MIKTYETKPCKIQAIEFTRNSYEEVVRFTNGKASNLFIEKRIDGFAYCNVETLEGVMLATEGDFIIKGLRDEFYPCKPDVFNKKYQEINV